MNEPRGGKMGGWNLGVDIDEVTIKKYVEHQGKKDSGQLRLEL